MAVRTRHPDRHQRASVNLRPVTFELQLSQSGSRKATLDRANRLRGRGGRVCHFVHEAWCAGRVSDEQRNAAILGKLSDCVDQRIAACVVETVSDFDTIRVQLIT